MTIISYKSYSEKKVQADDLMNLYKDANWWEERSAKDIDVMLKSSISVGAWKEEKLIGFARAVSDGKFRAYIEDVVIHTEFRRTGMGKSLVGRLLEEISEIDIISLFCEEELIPFYENSHFKLSKSQCVMHRKKAVKMVQPQ
jgi:ribosomal protein S18 acetylase RimI-like enzyme